MLKISEYSRVVMARLNGSGEPRIELKRMSTRISTDTEADHTDRWLATRGAI